MRTNTLPSGMQNKPHWMRPRATASTLGRQRHFALLAMLCVAIFLAVVTIGQPLVAQEIQPNVPQSGPELIEPASESEQSNSETKSAGEVTTKQKGLNLLNLLRRGGGFMIPLALLSILVVAISIERLLALREEKLLPGDLVKELGNLSRNEDGFDPRAAFRACQAHPSAASKVLRVMLLKAGRPQSEVENAVGEAAEREATRLQSVVSWLTLAAAVAPLIGLLGTVWGMIQAFYDTTQLLPGQNKAEILAQGIYIALVTTLCGLIIAIPSAILAHFYDNRIVSKFHKIEELAASLTPMMEQFEGRVRATSAEPGESLPSNLRHGKSATTNRATGTTDNKSSADSTPSPKSPR